MSFMPLSNFARCWFAALVVGSAVSAAYHAMAEDSFSQAEQAARRFQMPPGFKLEVVATEPMLANPVAFSIDEQGRIFVVETHRFNTGVVDITKHTNWIESDLSLRTVEDRAKFLTENFGTNRAVLTRDSERIRLLVDTDGDGRVDQATTFAEEFKIGRASCRERVCLAV